MNDIEKCIVAYRHLLQYNNTPSNRYPIFHRFAKEQMEESESGAEAFALTTNFTIIHHDNRLVYLTFFLWYYKFYARRLRNDLTEAIERTKYPEVAYQFLVQPVLGALDTIADEYRHCSPGEADFWVIIVQHPDGQQYYAARCHDESSTSKLREWLVAHENLRILYRC